MFGGSGERNMASLAAKGVPTEWSVKEGAQKNIKWSAAIGTRGYTSPMIYGGKVFVGTNNGQPRDPKVTGEKAILMCFRESDGQFLWQVAHDMPPHDVAREAMQDGLCSTPAADRDHIYYITPAVEVVCADLSGKTVWRTDLMKELKVFPCYLCNCSPFVAGDRVYLTTGNGRDHENQMPSPNAPSFVALDKQSGKVVWQDASPGDKVVEGQWANPAFVPASQVVCPGGDGVLYGLDAATGKQLWRFDCNPKAEAGAGGKGAKNYLIATPTVADGRVYVGVGQNPDNGPGLGHFWCIATDKRGDVTPANENSKDPANQASALVWHFGGAAPKGGARDYVFGRTMSSCAVHDGLVYVAELDGFLHCLDAKTGQHYWEEDLKAAIWGAPLWADGKVYLGTDDGDVHIFAQGKEKRRLGKVEMEEPIKSTPVAVGNVLYVMTDKHLFAISGK